METTIPWNPIPWNPIPWNPIPEPGDPSVELPDELWDALWEMEEPQPDPDTEWAGELDELYELADTWPWERCLPGATVEINQEALR